MTSFINVPYLLAQKLQGGFLIPNQSDRGERFWRGFLGCDGQGLVTWHHRAHAFHQRVRGLQDQLSLVLISCRVAVDRAAKKEDRLKLVREPIKQAFKGSSQPLTADSSFQSKQWQLQAVACPHQLPRLCRSGCKKTNTVKTCSDSPWIMWRGGVI